MVLIGCQKLKLKRVWRAPIILITLYAKTLPVKYFWFLTIFRVCSQQMKSCIKECNSDNQPILEKFLGDHLRFCSFLVHVYTNVRRAKMQNFSSWHASIAKIVLIFMSARSADVVGWVNRLLLLDFNISAAMLHRQMKFFVAHHCLLAYQQMHLLPLYDT